MDKDRVKITTNPPLFKIVPTWHFIMQLIRRAFELSVLVPAYLYVKDNLEQIEKDIDPCPEIEHLIFFAKTSKRGLCS